PGAPRASGPCGAPSGSHSRHPKRPPSGQRELLWARLRPRDQKEAHRPAPSYSGTGPCDYLDGQLAIETSADFADLAWKLDKVWAPGLAYPSGNVMRPFPRFGNPPSRP